jgi:hypothetical protein
MEDFIIISLVIFYSVGAIVAGTLAIAYIWGRHAGNKN